MDLDFYLDTLIEMGLGPYIIPVIIPFTLLASVCSIYSIYYCIRSDNTKPDPETSLMSSNDSSRDKKSYRDKIKELQRAILKQSATTEGLTLLVGALSAKVDEFQKLENSVDERFVNMCATIRRLEQGFETVGSEIDEIIQSQNDFSKDTTSKFVKVQRNFAILHNDLKDFTTEEYEEFKEHVLSDVKTLHDAIFIPVDSDSGSEYEN